MKKIEAPKIDKLTWICKSCSDLAWYTFKDTATHRIWKCEYCWKKAELTDSKEFVKVATKKIEQKFVKPHHGWTVKLRKWLKFNTKVIEKCKDEMAQRVKEEKCVEHNRWRSYQKWWDQCIWCWKMKKISIEKLVNIQFWLQSSQWSINDKIIDKINEIICFIIDMKAWK